MDKEITPPESEFQLKFPVSRHFTSSYFNDFRLDYQGDRKYHISETQKLTLTHIQENLDLELSMMTKAVGGIGYLLAVSDIKDAGVDFDEVHELGWFLHHLRRQMNEHQGDLMKTVDILDGCVIDQRE